MTRDELIAAIRSQHANEKAGTAGTLTETGRYYRHELRYRLRRDSKRRTDLADRQYHGAATNSRPSRKEATL